MDGPIGDVKFGNMKTEKKNKVFARFYKKKSLL